MTLHYNRKSEIDIRKKLRQNQTYSEKFAWSFLKGRQLLGLKFKRQFSIDKYIIDFYCAELKLAVEIDGNIHELISSKIKDEKRQNFLENYGVRFIRIKNDELLGNPEKVFKSIEDVARNILIEIKINQPPDNI